MHTHRNKENKEIFSKISEENIITLQRLNDEARGQKRKAQDLASEGADAGGGSTQAAEANSSVLPLTLPFSGTVPCVVDVCECGKRFLIYGDVPGGSGLITNDLPMALPVPVSLSSTTADSAKERRLF
jgi:hypothetical protein